MSKGYWFSNMLRSKTLRVMMIVGMLAILGIAGCGGDDDDSPTTPEAVEKCLEVGPVSTWGWPVYLKNKETGETLKSFSIISVSACVYDSEGNLIACYDNAVVENGELVSFDATIDGENYSYPADAC